MERELYITSHPFPSFPLPLLFPYSPFPYSNSHHPHIAHHSSHQYSHFWPHSHALLFIPTLSSFTPTLLIPTESSFPPSLPHSNTVFSNLSHSHFPTPLVPIHDSHSHCQQILIKIIYSCVSRFYCGKKNWRFSFFIAGQIASLRVYLLC